MMPFPVASGANDKSSGNLLALGNGRIMTNVSRIWHIKEHESVSENKTDF